MFEVRQTLKPGDAGTRKLAARFGDKLVCIRYRVELIVDQAPLTGRRVRPSSSSVPDRNPMVGVRIFYREDALREKGQGRGSDLASAAKAVGNAAADGSPPGFGKPCR
jgi:hypothetical protein